MENPQGYTHEFKAEAVKLVLNQGLSLREAAKRLSLPKGTLTNWVSNAKGGVVASAPGARSVPLKLPGAWWTPTNVEAMLALRLNRANREYDGYWRGIEKQAA